MRRSISKVVRPTMFRKKPKRRWKIKHRKLASELTAQTLCFMWFNIISWKGEDSVKFP